jgi:cytochrome c oxidase cbb3-type subunit 1
MQPYYVWRGIGGSLMFLSHIVFAWTVWRMTYGRAGDSGSPIIGPTGAEAAL